MACSNFRLSLTTIASLLLCALPFSSVVADEDSRKAKIAHAMSAAPANISAEATIMDVDGTILREGSNGWTCLPGVALMPGDNHPMCNDATWMRFMKAAAEGQPFSTEVVGYSYMLMGDALVNNDDPTATDPNDGGPWVEEGPHVMLLMPSKSHMDGLSRDPFAGGPYVMWDKTPLAHVMLPIAEPQE